MAAFTFAHYLAVLSTLLWVGAYASDIHELPEFYFDEHALLFGLNYRNTCYVQVVSADDAKHLTDPATLTHFEIQLLSASEKAHSLRWSYGHLHSMSSFIANMCINVLDIYVIEEHKVTLQRDCQEVMNNGNTKSGVYEVHPVGLSNKIQVYCDMDTDGGGWLVFQKRKDGFIDFYRDWNAYKTGFGDISGEFWLGNKNLHYITKQRLYSLRVDMEGFKSETGFAKYHGFSIGTEIQKYLLRVEGYVGNRGDELMSINGLPFSTFDNDNDAFSGSCAHDYHGAWWYYDCTPSNLNGLYSKDYRHDNANIFWYDFHFARYPLKSTQMKIKPAPA